jgi:sodium/hydrogen exchanger 8
MLYYAGEIGSSYIYNNWRSLFLNSTYFGLILQAYYVKKNKYYSLPESGVAMLVGILIGGIARLTVTDLTLFSFSPELFFFVLLPPIIFEAGYSLEKTQFFENIGAITLFAFLGTIISAFVVGMLTYWSAQLGLIRHIDKENPMEALLFGSLISAVDPVATLAIMGNPELQCDNLLYSLVFGESVLNDAVAIVLFKTFHKFYDPDGPDWSRSVIPKALFSFGQYVNILREMAHVESSHLIEVFYVSLYDIFQHIDWCM